MSQNLLDLSNYTANPQSVPTLITSAAMLLLGAYVLIRERGSLVSWTFALISLSVSIWLFCFSAMYAAADEQTGLFWAKAAYLGIPFIPAAVYSFTTAVLRILPKRRVQVIGGWLISAAFSAVFMATDLIVDGLYRFSWGYYPRFTPLSAPYLVFSVGLLFLSLREFQLAHRLAPPGVQRLRIRWLTISFGVGYIALVDYLPTFGLPVYPFGYGPVLAFLLLAAWTIKRYRLVDITPSFAADEIVSTIADPLIVCDAHGAIRVVNPATCRVLGYRSSELIDQPVQRIAGQAPDGESDLLEILRLSTVREHETRLMTQTGEPVEVSVAVSHLTDDRGELVGFVVIARDIRERKRVQAELAEVHHRLTQSREIERLHLAQELHDGPLQDLHGLSFQLQSLVEQVDGRRDLPELEALRSNLSHVTRTLRGICGELRPPSLAPFGLRAAIQSHLDALRQTDRTTVFEFELDDDGQRLPERTRIVLFRILQQALDNIAQHARADHVRVRLELRSGQVVLRVTDNGRGFHVPQRWVRFARAGHLGLVGAAERAESIGGRMEVFSSPGQGTTIEVSVPWSEKAVNRDGLQ